MTKYLLSFVYIALVTGCGSQFNEIGPLLQSRIPVAESMQEQGKYADALVQWRIILTANPDDEAAASQISELEALIANKINKLLSVAKKSNLSGDEKLIRKTYLQILALDPNNQIAIDALRKTEWKIAMNKANSKTQTIKQYFVESQAEAQRSILQTKFLEKGQQYILGRKYNSLIELADEFEVLFADANEPQNWRVLAYSKLAEKSLAAKDIEGAITYNDLAISTAPKGKVANLVKKNQKLRKQISDKYYKLAMRQFKTDLNQSIELLSKSVSFYSANVKAKQQLIKTKKIRDNLLKIKSMQR